MMIINLEEKRNTLLNKLRQTPLKIFICGPGIPNSGASCIFWEKKVKIKNELKQEFPKSEVFFGEDILEEHKLPGINSINIYDVLERCDYYYENCDICIILLTENPNGEIRANGASHELGRFTYDKENLSKIYLLKPESTLTDFHYTGKLYNQPSISSYNFNLSEFEECNLVKKAISRVHGFLVNEKI